MCGFVGIFEKKPCPETHIKLKKALGTLRNRGPDSELIKIEYLSDWKISLGHRRLKIIDLNNRADQPFSCGHVTVLFNGEIYNYIELRKELKDLGAVFCTESDTEVIAKSYVYWGTLCIQRFDGAFAILIIDHQKKNLVIARDPFGEKPLFFKVTQTSMVFGSTADSIKVLLDNYNTTLNKDWVVSFLTYGFSPAPISIWHGIKKLSAGEVFQISLDSGYTKKWNLAASNMLDESIPEQNFNILDFEQLLVSSLERRLRADVPIGILLSGGIDSSYLTSLIKLITNKSVFVFTIHDRDDSSNEVIRAKKICNCYGLDHKVLPFPNQTLEELIIESIPAMDEPNGDPAFPMLSLIFSQIPKEIRVAFTGDGADELFLSYINYRQLLRINRGFVANALSLLIPWIMGYLQEMGLNGVQIARRLVYESALPTLSRFRILHDSGIKLCEINGLEPNRIEVNDLNERALWRYSLKYELPEYLLVKADRASMYHSIESRTPYLNKELLRYILTCHPESLQLGHKTHIKSRLQVLLGSDLDFSKRGFFALGQKMLQRKASWHPYVIELCGWKVLEMVNDPRRIDSLSYYRLYVLNQWLYSKCE